MRLSRASLPIREQRAMIPIGRLVQQGIHVRLRIHLILVGVFAEHVIEFERFAWLVVRLDHFDFFRSLVDFNASIRVPLFEFLLEKRPKSNPDFYASRHPMNETTEPKFLLASSLLPSRLPFQLSIDSTLLIYRSFYVRVKRALYFLNVWELICWAN